MKKVIISLLTAAGLVASASAASVYTGASLGYLIDNEEAIFTAKIGTPFSVVESQQFEKIAHNLEFELGFTTDSESGSGVKVDADVIPLMINYRVEAQKQGWAPYAGVGIGASIVKVSAELDWYISNVSNISARDTVFTGQVFVGVNYNFSEATSLKLGARYMHLAAPTLASLKLDDIDDAIIEAGFTFRF